MDHKIIYIRNSNRTPVGCIAYKRDRDKNTILLGFSFCHSRDSFDKRIGRLIATQRLQKKPYTLNYVIFNEYDSQIHTNDLLSIALTRAANEGVIPNSYFKYINLLKTNLVKNNPHCCNCSCGE